MLQLSGTERIDTVSANSAPAVIRARDIVKKVDSSGNALTILDGISLEVRAQESLAICGSSGSGKTTLLSILAGMDTPSSGAVFLNANNIAEMDEEDRAKVRASEVGFVFQSFQLIPSLSALENVMLPLELKRDKEAKIKAEHFLTKVGVGHRQSHLPHQLSGGEQQRVAIARAFACAPRILFADEPTGNLDTKTGRYIMDLLFELNQEQSATLVLVTHDEHLAERCDRRIYLAEGKIVA
ncbi:ABC transporter ATP-binding protein [Oleiphilus messinensis]|nr:ABC transporter ATP-binding protein [Oleiphilus messinensis]